MSTQNRRIKHYSIHLEFNDEKDFERDLLKRLLRYIDSLEGVERINNDKKAKKATGVQSIQIYEKQGMEFARIVFKSCKYNHSPNLMSSIDGTERPSDKLLTEGDKELTHVLMRFDPEEAYTICENRQSGISFKSIIDYLNASLVRMIRKEGIDEKRKIGYSCIPSENYSTIIDGSSRITNMEIYTENKWLGSQYMNLMELTDSFNEEIVISVKAKKKESIAKSIAKGIFQKVTSTERSISRVRLYMKDENNFNVVLDSLGAVKNEEITVELREDGTVDTFSIFSKMEEALGVFE